MSQAKKAKVSVKVVERAKAAAVPNKPAVKAQANARKAKVVAALKRLHPMD